MAPKHVTVLGDGEARQCAVSEIYDFFCRGLRDNNKDYLTLAEILNEFILKVSC